MSIDAKMTAIADELRTLTGNTAEMSLDDMANAGASANAEVDSQADLMTQIITALEAKDNSKEG